MNPIIELLSPYDLSFLGGIADYTSLTWENLTTNCGSFEIHVPREMAVSCGTIVHIVRDIPEPYGVASCVKLTDGETVIMGSTISRLFDYRYPCFDGAAMTLTTSLGVGKLITLAAASGIGGKSENYFFGTSPVYSYHTSSESVSFPIRHEASCLETMSSIAEDGGVGFGCTLSGGGLKVFTYPYTNRGLVLDKAFGAIYDLSYTRSNDNLRNTFGYLLGTHDTGFIYNYSPGISAESGCDRFVLYVGSSDTAPSAVIREKKAQMKAAESVEGIVRLAYPDKFALGDIVTVKNDDWGLSKAFSITGVSECWEDDYSCRVTFGNPQDSVYRKLIKKLK